MAYSFSISLLHLISQKIKEGVSPVSPFPSSQCAFMLNSKLELELFLPQKNLVWEL